MPASRALPASPRVYAIIQARMTSSRLPGKVLKPVRGFPLLSHMLRRVAHAQTLTGVMVATTVNKEDDAIVRVCEKDGVPVYRGSETDVLDRYYKSARLVNADIVVRLTSDCPLIDPQIIDLVVGEFLQRQCDYVANTTPLPTTWPDGQNVEVFSFKALERSWHETSRPSDREHVTFHMWMQPGKFELYRIESPEDLSQYRLTVDYEQDYDLVKALIEALSPAGEVFTLGQIVEYLELHPELKALNAGIDAYAGWRPSLDADKQHGFEPYEFRK